MLFHDRVAESELRMDAVQVATALAAPLDVAGVLQVAQDAIRIPLADVCCSRNLPDANVRSLSNGEEDLGVVRDERPAPRPRMAELTWRWRHCTNHGAAHSPEAQWFGRPKRR